MIDITSVTFMPVFLKASAIQCFSQLSFLPVLSSIQSLSCKLQQIEIDLQSVKILCVLL